jgi:hypothetical protein
MKTSKELISDTITFLDMELSTQVTNNTYQFLSSVHYKNLASYSYLHWKSAHPRAIKRAVIRGELSRRIRLSSSTEAWLKTQEDLTKKLIRRNYPAKEIEEAIGLFDFGKRKLHLNRTCAKILKRRTQTKNPFHFPIENPKTLVPLVIRYDPRSH